MAYWQTIISVLIVAFAGVYLGWRGWARLRSLVSKSAEIKSSCASGCGGCGQSRDGCGMWV